MMRRLWCVRDKYAHQRRAISRAIRIQRLARHEEPEQMDRGVYSGRGRTTQGEEHENTSIAANNYLSERPQTLRRFEEAMSLMRKTMRVARRALGNNDKLTLKMRTYTQYRS